MIKIANIEQTNIGKKSRDQNKALMFNFGICTLDGVLIIIDFLITEMHYCLSEVIKEEIHQARRSKKTFRDPNTASDISQKLGLKRHLAKSSLASYNNLFAFRGDI